LFYAAVVERPTDASSPPLSCHCKKCEAERLEVRRGVPEFGVVSGWSTSYRPEFEASFCNAGTSGVSSLQSCFSSVSFKRRARRRAVGTRAPILVEAMPNARRSLDFVHDQFANGRRFRILNIVDDVTRECLAAIPDTLISGRRVARELTALIERRGKPGMIVSDNGTEFTCNAMLTWEDQPDCLVLHRAGKAHAERLL
jgi:Integrase core domain